MASPLVDAHIRGQERLRALTSQAIGSIWDALPAYDEANVPDFLNSALPVVRSAQRQSVALTDAFISRSLRRRPIGINPDDVIGANARAGTDPAEVYRRPFVTVWTALANNTDYVAALAAGAARATSTAAMDVQLASRGTFTAVQEADDSIRGYQRVADPGACEFCQSIDGAFVKSADAMALHNNCGCSLEPITGSVRSTPVPDDVAVHEHGELGAVLTAPDDHFTKL